MKIAKYEDSPSHQFDSETAKGVTGRVVIGKEDKAENFCMRLFTLVPGGFTPRHSHTWEHEIFVHAGTGQILENGEWREVTRDTVIFIPGNEEHQFKNESEEDFIFICLIPSGVAEI